MCEKCVELDVRMRHYRDIASRITDHRVSKPGEPPAGKEAPEPSRSYPEEARRLIEESADDLRAIIKKIRRHLT
jgi:hypothetical protein